MSFTQVMDRVAQGFEGLGAAILVFGFVLAVVLAWRSWRRTGRAGEGYQVLRECFGGTLLLALEVLVAADLIRTVAVAPSLDNVAVLGVIVLIRTFLSFSLEIEIEGVAPWRRALTSGTTATRQAVRRAGTRPEPPSA
ncbi:DUF1622 domain-containing protein [Streptacidiphilus neutrinimicus]|uniref:DUF1622 domain-containing protein n=1 Tax=Streptacidiphilus neutrinimicus TaxID=105420 RepID=UPI000A054FD9|nr:DUF1622 domain-containing protein [Streptacidiphilus neutrinimicus]